MVAALYAPQIATFAQSLLSPLGQYGIAQSVNDAKAGRYGWAVFGAVTAGNLPAAKSGAAVSGVMKGIEKIAETAKGLKIGEKYGSLGTVISNKSGTITGFNHDGTYHGLDRIIGRAISPEAVFNTVKTPLARFAGRFDRTGYLSMEAFIVLDKAGAVVTAISKNEFKSTIINVLEKITK